MFDFFGTMRYQYIINSDGHTPNAIQRSATPCTLAACLGCNGREREKRRVESLRVGQVWSGPATTRLAPPPFVIVYSVKESLSERTRKTT